MQTSNWVFTLNNPESNEEPQKWNVKYAIWQREKGDSGTEHLQGYVVVPRCTLAAMKKRNGTAHWEPRRGSHDQAKAYSSKEDTRIAGPWVIGKEAEPCQGKRTDLLSLKASVDGGATLAALAEEHFIEMAKYSRWIREYRILKGMQQRSWLTYTAVYWGPPGTGKTSRVLREAPAAYWMKKPANGQAVFFDGYDGHEDVVIDEFYGWIPYDLLCRMCDRYPLMVDTKGGAVQFCPKRIFITSNKQPADWYKFDIAALQRRISGDMGKVEFVYELHSSENMNDISFPDGVPSFGPFDDDEGSRATPSQHIVPAIENVCDILGQKRGYDSDKE